MNAFVLFEGLPALLCPGCRQRIADEANMAARGYDQEEANYLVGFACGLAAAVAGGCAWWLIALGSGRIFALLALGIGVFVAWAYRQGARKLDLTGQVGGAVLTVAGVLLGEVLFYASQIAQAQPEVGFRLDAGLWGLGRMLQVAPAEVLFSLLFGAIGAWAAVKMLRRPRFAPRIETPEEAVAAKRRAA